MANLLRILIIVFDEKWLSNSEYARILAACCRREDAQQIARLSQDYIEVRTLHRRAPSEFSMAKLFEALLVLFQEEWMTHGEFAKILAASCQREAAQQMKCLWQFHIVTAYKIDSDNEGTSEEDSSN